MDNPDIQYPIAKAAAAAAAAGAVNVVVVTQWLQLISAAAAAIYGCAVIVEWVIKKVRARNAKRHAKAAT